MKAINVNLGVNKYNIIIKKHILDNLGNEIREIYYGSKIALITDENVFKLYGNSVKEALIKYDYRPSFIILEPGEKSKSIEMLKKVYEELVNYEITRSDLIIAFGGGVVGDLAGFAAATFLRGVNYVQVPTSLLAQIDSSIGGKVAVNLEQGKNLVGSFYQPKKVIIDTDTLNSLPEKFIKDGLGEVIKYACIKDSKLFDKLSNIKSKEELFENLEYIIYTCCNIKKSLVEIDERDNGVRMLLNFGHTLGHAIENYYNYEFSHGEAVALGMYYITKKSEAISSTEPGTAEKIKNLLINFEINYNLPDLNMKAIQKSIHLDKKNISGKINLVLLRKIGDAFIEGIPVEKINDFFVENI